MTDEKKFKKKFDRQFARCDAGVVSGNVGVSVGRCIQGRCVPDYGILYEISVGGMHSLYRGLRY
jgi:hypothetical protein